MSGFFLCFLNTPPNPLKTSSPCCSNRSFPISQFEELSFALRTMTFLCSSTKNLAAQITNHHTQKSLYNGVFTCSCSSTCSCNGRFTYNFFYWFTNLFWHRQKVFSVGEILTGISMVFTNYNISPSLVNICFWCRFLGGFWFWMEDTWWAPSQAICWEQQSIFLRGFILTDGRLPAFPSVTSAWDCSTGSSFAISARGMFSKTVHSKVRSSSYGANWPVLRYCWRGYNLSEGGLSRVGRKVHVNFFHIEFSLKISRVDPFFLYFSPQARLIIIFVFTSLISPHIQKIFGYYVFQWATNVRIF